MWPYRTIPYANYTKKWWVNALQLPNIHVREQKCRCVYNRRNCYWSNSVMTDLRGHPIKKNHNPPFNTQLLHYPTDMCTGYVQINSSIKLYKMSLYQKILKSPPLRTAGTCRGSQLFRDKGSKGQRVKLQFGPHSWSLKQSRWVKMENWPGDQMRSDNQKLHIDTNKVQNHNFDKYYVPCLPCSFNIKKSRQAIVMPLINLSHPHRSSHPYLQCLTKAQTSQTSLV